MEEERKRTKTARALSGHTPEGAHTRTRTRTRVREKIKRIQTKGPDVQKLSEEEGGQEGGRW